MVLYENGHFLCETGRTLWSARWGGFDFASKHWYFMELSVGCSSTSAVETMGALIEG